VMGNVVSLVNSMSMRSLPHLSVNFFTRSNASLNINMVPKISYKSTDNSFCRSISCREGKSISRVSVYSTKNKAPSLMETSIVINLSLGS
uniref:Uncharacterized protein n=1 Tax=Monodon monoceros TaxID=40151 RepID=A0A8C6AKC7_MONMO